MDLCIIIFIFLRPFSPERKERPRGRTDDRSGMADFPASPPQVKEDYGFKTDRPDNFGYRLDLYHIIYLYY